LHSIGIIPEPVLLVAVAVFVAVPVAVPVAVLLVALVEPPTPPVSVSAEEQPYDQTTADSATVAPKNERPSLMVPW